MSFSLVDVPADSYRRLLEAYQRGILVVDEDFRLVYINALLTDLLGKKAEDLLGQCPLQVFGFADDSLPWDANRDLEFRNLQGFVRQLRFRAVGETPAGPPIAPNARGLWRWIAVVDVTDEERAMRRNLALSQVASSLTFAGSVAATLDQIAANVVTATRTKGCSILLISGTTIRMVGMAGLHESYPVAIQHLFDNTAFPVTALEAYRQRKPMVARGMRAKAKDHVPEARAYLDSATWSVVCSVPLQIQGRAQGSLNCYYDEELEPEEEVLPFLQAVADQAAMLVENARLIEELQGKAVLEERQRIARELHDSVSQALYGISLGTNAALVHLDQQRPEAVHDSLTYVLSLAEAGMCEMRSLIFELRPDSLESEGLVGVLNRQVKALEARHSVEVKATLVEPPLSLEAKHSLYRVVQEALGNVAKHAKARRVSLHMALDGRLLRIKVEDDGAGFDSRAEFPGHFGLKTMSERVAQLAGHLSLDSQIGRGTRLMVEVPIP